MTPEDKKFERIAQRHIADLKKSSKAMVEDATVRAFQKVMAEFAQGAHTEAKVEYHSKTVQCPHCDGSVRVPAQPHPDKFIEALKYDVAKRDSEALAEQPAQQQEPVAYDKTEINCFAQDLYDQKMREGKRGHYESMFHVIHQCIKKVSPPQRKPLTDEEIMNLCASEWASHPIEVARAIEAAHGITGETQ